MIIFIAFFFCVSSASASEEATVDSDNKIREGVYLGVAGPMAGLLNVVVGYKDEDLGFKLMYGDFWEGRNGYSLSIQMLVLEESNYYLSLNPTFSYLNVPYKDIDYNIIALPIEYNLRGLFIELGPAQVGDITLEGDSFLDV